MAMEKPEGRHVKRRGVGGFRQSLTKVGVRKRFERSLLAWRGETIPAGMEFVFAVGGGGPFR